MTTLQLSKYQVFLFAVLALAISGIYAGIFQKLYLDWMDDPNYSHGLLVPLISGYFIWQQRQKLEELEVKPANNGILPDSFRTAGSDCWCRSAGIFLQTFFICLSSCRDCSLPIWLAMAEDHWRCLSGSSSS